MITKKIFTFKNIYLFFLIYFFYNYFNTGFILDFNVKSFLDKYFGLSKYIVFIILLGNYFVEYIKKEKRNATLTIIFFIYLFYLAFVTIFLSYKLNLITQKPIPNLEYNFIKYCIFDFNFGLISAFFISNIILTKNIYIFYLALIISSLVCLFMGIIITNRIFIKSYKYIKIEYNKRKLLEKKEEKVKEKIAIKEAIEKNEIKQLEQIEEYKEKMIQEQVILLKEKESESEFHIFEIKSSNIPSNNLNNTEELKKTETSEISTDIQEPEIKNITNKIKKIRKKNDDFKKHKIHYLGEK